MHKKLIFRYMLFAILLLIIIPIIGSLFVKGGRLYNFDTIYALAKFYIISVVVLGVLIVILKDKKIKINKINYWILAAGLLLIFSSFYFYSDFEKIQNEGFTVLQKESIDEPGFINFDYEQYLNIPSLTRLKDAYSIPLMNNNDKVEKRVFLKEITRKQTLKIHAGWQDFAKTKQKIWQTGKDDGVFSSEIKLSVNDRQFDISKPFAELKEGEFAWFNIELNQDVLKEGENKIVLECRNCSDLIRISAQSVYYKRDTYKNGEKELVDALIFVKQRNTNWFSTWFKLLFIQKLIGILLIITGLFSLKFIKFLFTKAKFELLFSTLILFFINYLNEFFINFWIYISKITAYVVYVLLKISFLKPVIDASITEAPIIGSYNFSVQIADVCSGIESLGLFLLLYTIFIVFGWKKIDKRKALLMYIPGLVLTFLLNCIRIFILILIGTFISKDLALNMFHSLAAMVLFIIFFAVFMYYTNKIVKK